MIINRCTLLVLLPAGVVLARPLPPPADPPQGLRLDGTFIQYQSWMMDLTAGQWEREVLAMKRAGLGTIIIQWLQNDGVCFVPADGSKVDPTESILGIADRERLDVWIGLAMDRTWWQWSAGELGGRLVRDMSAMADLAWSRYGHHRSFAGWYIPTEPSDGLTAGQARDFKPFLREVAGHCRGLSGPKPVGFSPFVTGQADPGVMGRRYAELLDGAGIDVLMLQDGVGARGWETGIPGRVAPFFRAMREACLENGVQLWADVEVFRSAGAGRGFGPADTRRLKMQLAAESPFVSKRVAFDCFHYLSPYRGQAQQAFHEAYVREFVERPFFPLAGPGLIIDPTFAYYRDRSAGSIAAEIRANGYSIVHYISDPAVKVRPELVEALHRDGIGVWHQAFGNGTYNRALLPDGWRDWRMVTRTELEGKALNDGYQRLCLNHDGYRAWKKQDLARAARAGNFDGIEIAEPHWPEYPGPASPAFGCFCDACRQGFRRMYPGESSLPDILHAESPLSPGRNPALWEKYLRFRQASLTAFLDDLVNGEGGLRRTCPGVKIGTWTLALADQDGVNRVRADSGEDAGEVAATVRPDLHCLQTHWPDWMRGDLPADYVRQYLPFVEQLRSKSAGIPLSIQTDIGSTRPAIRDRAWIDRFEASCQAMGVESTCLYEYAIGGWIYHEPPRVTAVCREGETLELAFTRRLDPAGVRRPGVFHAGTGTVAVLEVDGSLVRLEVKAASPGQPIVLDVRDVTDDPARRLFPGGPPQASGPQRIIVPR